MYLTPVIFENGDMLSHIKDLTITTTSRDIKTHALQNMFTSARYNDYILKAFFQDMKYIGNL